MNYLRRFIIPLVAVAFFFVPLVTSNEYYVHSVMAKVCVYVILVAGLDLVVGYSGNVSVGHAGLFAVGAYTTAILMWKLDVPFPLAAIAGITLGAAFGVLLGVPALRLSGPYLAMTTIAFGLIIQTIVNESVWLTNGSQGIRDIPLLQYGPINFEGNNLFYLVYPLMLLSLLGVHRLVTSYWGRAFEALKESTVAAECSGISRYRYKLSAFVLSAALAGLAGALFVHIDKYIGPPTFSLQLSILFLIALILGGTRSVLGNIIGTFIVVVLPDVFNNIAEYQLMIFGGLLLFSLYFMPGGIAGLLRSLAARLFPAPRLATPTTEAATPEATAEREAEPRRERAAETVNPIATRTITGGRVSTNGHALLETNDLTIAFGGLVAVNKLDMRISPGEVHALIGPNGSGKSTTVNLLSGVYRPTGGRIQFAGKNIERDPPHTISRTGISRTFQNVALFGEMTVLENVLVGLHHTFHGGLLHVLFHTPRARREEKEARARAQSLLDFVGLGHLAAERARNLPYGQQRLLEIARALAQDPALILLDEPAAGLTSGEITVVDDLIDKLKARGLSILLIEHHMDLVMAVADEITVLDFGKKIAEGAPDEIQQNERVISAYLGTTVHDGANRAATGKGEIESADA
jgi:branched-chain amino acid transport system permease protein